MDGMTAPSNHSGSTIDLSDESQVDRLIEKFGINREQLAEAVQAAGADEAAVEEHLRNQGASAGAG